MGWAYGSDLGQRIAVRPANLMRSSCRARRFSARFRSSSRRCPGPAGQKEPAGFSSPATSKMGQRVPTTSEFRSRRSSGRPRCTVRKATGSLSRTLHGDSVQIVLAPLEPAVKPSRHCAGLCGAREVDSAADGSRIGLGGREGGLIRRRRSGRGEAVLEVLGRGDHGAR